MNKLSAKLVLLIFLSCTLPLIFYGVFSVREKQLILWGALFCIASLLAGLFLIKNEFLTPLSLLLARLKEMASGKFEGQIHLVKSSAFAPLATAINQLSFCLRQTQQESIIKNTNTILEKNSSDTMNQPLGSSDRS